MQEVDDENIAAVRVSLGRYILRERDYEFDVPPMYKKIKNRKVLKSSHALTNSQSYMKSISLQLESLKGSTLWKP